LDEVSTWFFPSKTIQENLNRLSELFKIKTICVTLGEDGAMLLHNNEFFKSAGFEVEVVDTIGSGDSFLASFISNFLKNTPVEHALVEACAMGALVATHHGASPVISQQEVQLLISKKLK
jgi:fructokinase